MHSFVNYLKNVRGELTHVVWPTQRQAVMHVILIVLISAFTALFLSALDYLFTSGVSRLVGT